MFTLLVKGNDVYFVRKPAERRGIFWSKLIAKNYYEKIINCLNKKLKQR